MCYIRHAKSSWAQPGLSDHQRPLNERGLRDAPIMARKLLDVQPDLQMILSSDSQRTRMTSSYFIEAYELPQESVVYTPQLYHPRLADVYRVIGEVPDHIDKIAVIGHNPCWTEILQDVSDGTILNVPTCGIGVVDYDVQTWSAVSGHIGTLRSYIYPKFYSE